MLTVRDLEFDRIVPIAADLCAEYMAELDAAGIADAVAMLREAVPWCLWVQEADWDGKPIAVFGVRPHHGMGVPWMLTTAHMDGAASSAVAMAARRAVLRMRGDFSRLANLVHRRNERAIRFIEALRFNVHRDTPRGPRGEFYLFDWEREACAIR